ncbi:protein of unknown function [Streptomyces murinus]
MRRRYQEHFKAGHFKHMHFKLVLFMGNYLQLESYKS